MKYLSKITVKALGLDKAVLEDVVANNKGTTSVARIYGSVESMKVGNGQLGDYTRFHGEIEAQNLISDTQDKVRSQDLILPSIAEGIIISGLTAAKKESPDARCQFAIEITVEPNPSTLAGAKYKYGVRSLIDSKAKDALTMLAESLPPPPKFLPKKK